MRRLMLLAALLLSLTACGRSRACLSGHVINTVMPVTTCAKTCTTTILPTTQYVCDEYAPDKPK